MNSAAASSPNEPVNRRKGTSFPESRRKCNASIPFQSGKQSAASTAENSPELSASSNPLRSATTVHSIASPALRSSSRMTSASCGDFSSRRIGKVSAVVEGANFLRSIAFIVLPSGPRMCGRFGTFRRYCRFSIFAVACKQFASAHLVVSGKNQCCAQPVASLKGKQAPRNSPPNTGQGRRLGILQSDDKLACVNRRQRIRGSYAFPQRLRNPVHEFFSREPSIPLTKHSEVLHFNAHSHRTAGQCRPLHRVILGSRNRSVHSIRAGFLRILGGAYHCLRRNCRSQDSIQCPCIYKSFQHVISCPA